MSDTTEIHRRTPTNDGTKMSPLLVDAKQATWLLGIGRTTLYELIKTAELTPVRIGRCVRFRIADLERFVAKGCSSIGTPRPTTPQPVSRSNQRSPRRARSGGTAMRLFDPAS